jgi:hypothetical protein
MARKVIIGQKEKALISTGGAASGATVAALPSDRPLKGGVQLVAGAGNAGTVYVGVHTALTAGTDNDTDGYPLAAGDTIFLPASKESDIRHIASQAAQQLHYVSY